MASRRLLTVSQLNRVIGMLEGGLTQRTVAKRLGVSQSVVSQAWNRFLTTGDPSRRHAGGRQRATTPAQDRYLTICARRSRSSTAAALNRQFRMATGTVISAQTVRNRLHAARLLWQPENRATSFSYSLPFITILLQI